MAAADSRPQFLEMEDAVRYMKIVKASLENSHPARYSEFVNLMRDYRNSRIGIEEVASRVGELFRDRPDLIAGFNAILPSEHKIQLEVVGGVDEHELAPRFVRDVSLDDHHDDMVRDG
ncbi:hypothetical protein D1007_46849 [Hordeum vulgare]|nr:hypothetical protein D1007_46849 [Hordeum vulgare]